MKKIVATIAGLLFTMASFAQEELPTTAIKNVNTGKKIAFNESIEPGKVTLINFWATWCVSCIAHMPEMHSLQREFKDQLKILLVNGSTTGDTKETIAKFNAKRAELSLPLL